MKSIVFTRQPYDLPYVAQASTSGYIDLRTEPERIDEISELKAEPALKPLVLALNSPDGQFMTHGCAFGARWPGIPGSTAIPTPLDSKTAPCWYSSYVIFSFLVSHPE